jgi:hypothetical protein
LDSWEFEDDEAEILQATCESLDVYYRAQDQLAEEGLTFQAGDLIRQHPCCGIAKNAWSAFLGGLRRLKLEETGSKLIGRPPKGPGV